MKYIIRYRMFTSSSASRKPGEAQAKIVLVPDDYKVQASKNVDAWLYGEDDELHSTLELAIDAAKVHPHSFYSIQDATATTGRWVFEWNNHVVWSAK